MSYELRLWKVGDEFPSWEHECRDTDPGELVYTKQGLVNPEHKLETFLKPNSLYFWTVRAHFTLDGKRRATEWSEELPHFSSYGFVDLVFESRFESRKDGCSYPATFHLIRTPEEQSTQGQSR